MKRVIKASSGVVLSSDLFDLVKREGSFTSNIGGTWEGFDVISKGLAQDWVVEIRLYQKWSPDKGGEGTHTALEYDWVYVAYGMRTDGNRNISEFIYVLESAMDFAQQVANYLDIPYKDN